MDSSWPVVQVPRRLAVRPLAVADVLYWSLACGYVVITLTTGWPAYKAWAAWAVVPAVLGLLMSAVRLSAGGRRALHGLTALPLFALSSASAVALVVLCRERASGEIRASLSEVRVLERMGTELLRTGSPYLDTAALGANAQVFDYSPYTPAMSLFGVPAGLLGQHSWTDSRLFCLLMAAAALAAAVRLSQVSHSVTSWQLVLNPLVLLMAVVSGTDIGVIALMILAIALAGNGRPRAAGAAVALGVGMKLTAAPVVLIAAALVLTAFGTRALIRFSATAGAVLLVLTVPVLAADPPAFVDNVIKYPAGLTSVASSAASPLPGHLLSEQGDLGRTLALALLLAAVVALALWVVLRPPATIPDALRQTAVALTAATLLLPASRFGYVVYPLTLWGASRLLRAPEHPSTQPRPAPAADGWLPSLAATSE